MKRKRCSSSSAVRARFRASSNIRRRVHFNLVSTWWVFLCFKRFAGGQSTKSLRKLRFRSPSAAAVHDLPERAARQRPGVADGSVVTASQGRSTVPQRHRTFTSLWMSAMRALHLSRVLEFFGQRRSHDESCKLGQTGDGCCQDQRPDPPCRCKGEAGR